MDKYHLINPPKVHTLILTLFNFFLKTQDDKKIPQKLLISKNYIRISKTNIFVQIYQQKSYI